MYRVGQKSQYTDKIKYLLIKCMKLLYQSKELHEMKTKRIFEGQLCINNQEDRYEPHESLCKAGFFAKF